MNPSLKFTLWAVFILGLVAGAITHVPAIPGWSTVGVLVVWGVTEMGQRATLERETLAAYDREHAARERAEREANR